MNTQSNKAFNSCGTADDSVGGAYQTSSGIPPSTSDNNGPQDRANTDYGVGGPSAGHENNVQRTGGMRGRRRV